MHEVSYQNDLRKIYKKYRRGNVSEKIEEVLKHKKCKRVDVAITRGAALREQNFVFLFLRH